MHFVCSCLLNIQIHSTGVGWGASFPTTQTNMSKTDQYPSLHKWYPVVYQWKDFADDANSFISHTDPNSPQTKNWNNSNIIDCLAANKLLLNMSKICHLIFTSPNKNISNYLNSIKLGDTTIERTATSQHLGIILDDKLTWQAHI